MPDKVLVTGGMGFIGSHLCDALTDKGYEVVVVRNLSTGGSLDNVRKAQEAGGVLLKGGSILDLDFLKSVMHEVKVVFHLAAINRAIRSIQDPIGANAINITGTLNVLVAARDCGVRKVIYSSSSSVYGEISGEKSEDMLPCPCSPYAVGKLAGECYCDVFSKQYGLNTVSLRYFNIYGPRQDAKADYAAVIPKFIDSMLHDKPPMIYGDGEQTKDFTYVKDAVVANLLFSENDSQGVFNIGTGMNITINGLVSLLNSIMGKDIKPVYCSERPGDFKYSLANISKARKAGYEPRYTLESGLKETIASFR